MAVLGAEEFLGQGDGVGGSADNTDSPPVLLELLNQEPIGILRGLKRCREFSIFAFQSLNLLSLSLPGRLGSAAIPEHTLHSPLLLLVFGLGSFPRR
jgi:hypothetical protein